MRISASAVALVCLSIAGCPERLTPPPDTGSDSGAPVDAPRMDAGPVDAPGTDAPGSDTPGTDAPLDDVTIADAGSDADLDAPIPPGCGDGTVNGTEDCEPGMLGTATCTSEGFFGGTLGCAIDCNFDTSACTNCGNATIEAGEACDGTNLNGGTCVTEGFDEGTVTCNATCTDFVTTACARCGDGTLNGTEECDTTSFGTSTCVTEGFMTGSLTCGSDCTIGTAGCSTCGNTTIEGAEVCDGTSLNGMTCVTAGFMNGSLTCNATCTGVVTTACNRCGDNMARNGEACDGTDLVGETCVTRGFLSGSLGCSTACAFDTSMCSNARPPTAGEIVITEIMPDPEVIGDTMGEWFEVHNTSSALLALTGCVFTDNFTPTPNMFTVTMPVEIPAGGYATFARSAAPGFTPTYVYGSWPLANTNDEIRITCGGTLIDSVLYTTAAQFHFAPGIAMSLAPAGTATTNDVGASWCQATGTYGTGATPDRGSPGVANPLCAVTPTENCTNGTDDDGDSLIDCADVIDCAAAPTCVPLTIGFCRLQFPLTISGAAGAASPTVFGRVFVAGLTDMSATNNVDSRLVAAVGRGPDGTDPSLPASGWVWTTAAPNAGWDGSVAGEPNNDEYQATFTLPGAAGAYDYAYRFSGDGGTTWTYCDTNAGAGSDGSQDGYQTANAGALTVTGTSACHVVINELSAAGPAGANDEFVELFNPCATDVDVTGWRIAYRASAGTMDTVLVSSLTGTIPAGGFRVYVGSTYSGGGTTDGVTGTAMAAGGGGVALRVSATGAIVDSVGFGTATNAFVEVAAAPAPPATGSIVRQPDGDDGDNNSLDFTATATRTPRAANP